MNWFQSQIDKFDIFFTLKNVEKMSTKVYKIS